MHLQAASDEAPVQHDPAVLPLRPQPINMFDDVWQGPEGVGEDSVADQRKAFAAGAARPQPPGCVCWVHSMRLLGAQHSTPASASCTAGIVMQVLCTGATLM